MHDEGEVDFRFWVKALIILALIIGGLLMMVSSAANSVEARGESSLGASLVFPDGWHPIASPSSRWSNP